MATKLYVGGLSSSTTSESQREYFGRVARWSQSR
jgi:hypothetical protein